MLQKGHHDLVWWGDALGASTHFGGAGNAGTLNDALGGFMVGADAAINAHLRAGIFAGYSNDNFTLPTRSASGSSNNVFLGVYGGRNIGRILLSAGASYGQNYLSTNRSVGLPGLNEAETSSYDATTAQVFGQIGYRLTYAVMKHRVNVLPFAQLAYVSLSSAAFQELGGSAALHGYGTSLSTAYSSFGARADTGFTLKGRALTAFASLAWQHGYGTINPVELMSFAQGQPFAVQGVGVSHDAALTQLGVAMRLTPKISANIAYNGTFAKQLSNNGVNAAINWKF